MPCISIDTSFFAIGPAETSDISIEQLQPLQSLTIRVID